MASKKLAQSSDEIESAAVRVRAYAEELQRTSVALRQEADALLLEAKAILDKHESDSN